MKIKANQVKSILTAINILMDIKVLIRKAVPNYEFDEKQALFFKELISSLQSQLEPIFSEYSMLETNKESIESQENVLPRLRELMEKGNIALISSNTIKKRLKKVGFDPRNLFVTGGPLFFEDYRKISPNLSEQALKGIEKKCQNMIEQLKKENWKDKELLFIHEKDNPTDQLILEKKDEISKLIGKEVKTFKIETWEFLNES